MNMQTRDLRLETTMPSPLIIAHRGASALAPENTLAAFKRALAVGADGVEFDVRLSKDDVPVVIHDNNILRTTGVDQRVVDLTAEQLSRVDAGSWFNAAYPSRAQADHAAEGVPSLRSVLKLVENISGPIYIELKCETADDLSPLVDAVCREIADADLETSVIIESFHLGAIPLTRARLPGAKTAALFAPKVMRLLRKEKYLIKIARELGADHLCLHKSLVSRKLVQKAERYDMPVTVWTVNANRWVSWAARHGLFAVITDDPSMLLRGRETMSRKRGSEVTVE